MKYYTYIIINLINEKQYIGDHSTNNLNDGYLGSGQLIKKALKKYGKENFKKEVLELFETKQEAYNAQEKYINKYNTLVPKGYNIDPKGGSRPTSEQINKKIGLGNKGKKLSERAKRQISKRTTGENNPMYNHIYSETTLKKMSENNSGKNNPNFGKKMRPETKQKISNANKGRIKTKEEKDKISKGNQGKIRSEKTKKQISEKLKGRKFSQKTINKMKKPKTQEHIEKMKLAQMGRIVSAETKSRISKKIREVKKIKCKYCQREFLPWHYSQYHGPKCKLF